MAKTIIKATFKGKSGSLGYEIDKEYTLALEHNRVERTNGTGACVYGSVQSFLENWKNIKYVKDVNNIKIVKT